MFTRIKKSGKNEYLQIVENRREGNRTVQRVISTLGRMDRLQKKGEIERLAHSFSKYSEKVMLVLSEKSEVSADVRKIGPSLIFERLWEDVGMKRVIRKLLVGRKFEFDVERAIYLTVLHRLFVSGSDRSAERWRRDYVIKGVEELSLHQMYRAMGWIGEELDKQEGATPFVPRCVKDEIEEWLYFENRDLFSSIEVVFFDTTSIYFEGEGGEEIGQRGHSKDYRSGNYQMIVGVVLDGNGRPLCCEMWPGNTTDVKTLLPITEKIRKRFGVERFCVVSDRGMISKGAIEEFDNSGGAIRYILGVRMRQVKEEIGEELFKEGEYSEVYPESKHKKDPSPLKVFDVIIEGKRYVVCKNEREARKDAEDRRAIVESLKEKLSGNGKELIGNKGYRKYIRVERNSMEIDDDKIEREARYDGKWVLQTNMKELSPEAVALKYKQLWEVEQAFRDIKSVLETRPVFHQRDETIRGHVFCSFLALVLRKELYVRLEGIGEKFEWNDIKQDLKALKEVEIEDNGKKLAIRSKCIGRCGKVFQAVGVALPPTIRELR